MLLPGAFGNFPYPRSATRRGLCVGIIYSTYSVACSVCKKMKTKSLLICSLNLKQTILISRRQGAITLNPCCCVWCQLRIEPWNRGCEFHSLQSYLSALSIALCYFLFALSSASWDSWGKKKLLTKFWLENLTEESARKDCVCMYGW